MKSFVKTASECDIQYKNYYCCGGERYEPHQKAYPEITHSPPILKSLIYQYYFQIVLKVLLKHKDYLHKHRTL